MAFVTILGHRGSPREAPENTIESFLAARAAGADGVELDVRRGLLLSHDPLPDPAGAGVPTLGDALAACAGMIINVEIKNLPHEPGWDPEEALAREVAGAVAPVGDLIVVSAFTLATIDAVRAAAPAVRTGWLTLAGFDQQAAVATAVERGHSALHPHESAVTQDLVDAAHAAGLQLTTWTVDDPARMQELAAMGVDAIITNLPSLAVAALRTGP
ncbi:MAG: glycerophosphoryl diester phosphodiesterase [Actinomycetota bacterium]